MAGPRSESIGDRIRGFAFIGRCVLKRLDPTPTVTGRRAELGNLTDPASRRGATHRNHTVAEAAVTIWC